MDFSLRHHIKGLLIDKSCVVYLFLNLIAGNEFYKIQVVGSFRNPVGYEEVLVPVLIKIFKKRAPAPVCGGDSAYKCGFNEFITRLVDLKHVSRELVMVSVLLNTHLQDLQGLISIRSLQDRFILRQHVQG